MAREIKFRAWFKKQSKMRQVSDFVMYQEPTEEGNEGEVFFNDERTSHFFPEEAELMQFTGLRDRNGKDIYEGDVVGAFCNTQVRTVEWDFDRAGYFFPDCIVSGGAEPFDECLGNLTSTLEVLGNIYENPELLNE